MRVDRVYHEVATDEVGCTIFSQLNKVKVHKMRWLGNVSVDKEYRSIVVYLDAKEEVDRLLAKMTVTMPNGECAYTRPSVIGRQPARCYRCHLYGHLHYRYRAPAPVCGQCALPGHAASTCTSTTFKCAACGGKSAHKATDSGCPARGCPRLGRLAISDDYTTLYFSSTAMEESGLRPWSRAPELG
jgi:hypothetical protein